VLSPSSCLRCSKPEVMLSPSGLCVDCASTTNTNDPIPSDSSPTNPVFVALPAAPAARIATVAPINRSASRPNAPAGYDLLDRLGTGGMGAVYLARERASERLVAMKFLHHPGDPEAVDRFFVELRVLAQLDHPNIVRVLASDFLRADPYFTMEHMPGGSLTRALSENKPLPVSEAVRFIRAVADALAAAHAKGVIHRDLKPSNILLTAEGLPKISDFGLAKRLAHNDQLTRASGALGTANYMPPEQISRKNGKVGPWSDVYGLGATLYHLLTGRAPFEGDTIEVTIFQVLTDAPLRPRTLQPGIPLELEGIVLKCLEKDPKSRYLSMTDLAADLDRFQAGQKPTAPSLTRWRRTKRWIGRHRSLSALVVVLLLAGLFALGAMYWMKPADPLTTVQKELDVGKPVVLVGQTGRPRWYRWGLGESVLLDSETGDHTVALQSHAITFLELVPDPRHDHYRVTASLRHLHANPLGGTVGVYVGHDSVTSPAGIGYHQVVLAEFSEMYTIHEIKTPPAKENHGVSLVLTTLRAPPEQIVNFASTSNMAHFRFVGQEDKLPWRTITFEVSPDGIELFWGPEGEAPTFVGRVTAAEMARKRKSVEARIAKNTNTPIVLPEWHPRRPLGIWANDSTVLIKNVSIQPLSSQ